MTASRRLLWNALLLIIVGLLPVRALAQTGAGTLTGIALRNGYLYAAGRNTVVRWKMTAGQLKPAGEPETVVMALEGVRQHGDKGLTFDGKGGLYVNVGAPSNACQNDDRKPGSAGQDPCPILEMHGGIWKFD